MHVLAPVYGGARRALDAEALDGALLRPPLGRLRGLPVPPGQICPVGEHQTAVALGGGVEAIGEEPLHEGRVVPLWHGPTVVEAVAARLQILGEGLFPQSVLHGPGALQKAAALLHLPHADQGVLRRRCVRLGCRLLAEAGH